MRVVVTRAQDQAEELAAPLRELGFQVILLPMIGIAAPANPEPLVNAAHNCDRYDWIIFTSTNAVQAFASHLTTRPKARIATVGPATREAAERGHLPVHVTPQRYVAEGLIEALGREELQGTRILIPSAAVTRDILAPLLRECGACVEVVEAYRNVLPADAPRQAATVFVEPLPDWVTFASSSAVTNLVRLVGTAILGQVRLASIGPATSATIREHGLQPTIEASEHTIRGLVSAVSLCG